MSRIFLTVSLLLGVCFAALAEIPAPDVTEPIAISKFNDHLYVITTTGGPEFGLPPYGTNLVASVGPDGILLVDAGFGATGPALADTLRTMGDGKLRVLISTHYHGDHTFGNQFLSDRAVTIAHRNVLASLSGSYFHLSDLPNPNRPMVGFDDSLVIHFNGEEIHVVHTPLCHTSGDAYVYFVDSRVVAAGDLFFPDEIPYVDLNNGGSVSDYLNQVQIFIDSFPDDVTFIAAHGRQYDKDDLRKYVSMLNETTTAVSEAASIGKTAEELVADSVLADWQQWEGQFATTTLSAWIRTVHTELTGGWNALPSICEPLTKTIMEVSATEAANQYHRLKSEQPDAYDFREAQLNMLGYQLLMRQRVDDALEMFKLNVAAFPNSFNVYDSYAEALMLMGDTAQSIVNYEKSLELNPENTNAVEMLKRLRSSQ